LDPSLPTTRLLAALLASGVPLGEALGQLAQGCGCERAHLPILAALEWAEPRVVVEILDGVALLESELARTCLRAWGHGRQVKGDLDFSAKGWITELPVGLTVVGGLNLAGSEVVALPLGLVVGGDLDLRGCLRWDGFLSRGVRVDGKVRTDRHAEGIAAEAWGCLYPEGEGR
jgi:hypothetical protein